MSTKKKISDIDKAIEEMQQRRDECFKHIGKAMYESCPELGDMSVADMRKAGHYLHKMLTKKAPSQGAALSETARPSRPIRAARPPRTDASLCPWRAMARACSEAVVPPIRHPVRGVRGAPFRMGCFAESSAEAGWEWGASGGSKGAVKTAPSRAGRVTTKRRNFLLCRKIRSFVGTSPMLAPFLASILS